MGPITMNIYTKKAKYGYDRKRTYDRLYVYIKDIHKQTPRHAMRSSPYESCRVYIYKYIQYNRGAKINTMYEIIHCLQNNPFYDNYIKINKILILTYSYHKHKFKRFLFLFFFLSSWSMIIFFSICLLSIHTSDQSMNKIKLCIFIYLLYSSSFCIIHIFFFFSYTCSLSVYCNK